MTGESVDVCDHLGQCPTPLDLAVASRTLLLKAMWDARTELGFDPDGDEKFHSTNWPEIAAFHVREAQEVRAELDKADDALAAATARAEAAEAREAALRAELESLASQWEDRYPTHCLLLRALLATGGAE